MFNVHFETKRRNEKLQSKENARYKSHESDTITAYPDTRDEQEQVKKYKTRVYQHLVICYTTQNVIHLKVIGRILVFRL